MLQPITKKNTHRNFRKEQILSNQARNQKRFPEHHSLDVINKYFCFFPPVSGLSVISVLFIVIVIVIFKNYHSHGLYFLFLLTFNIFYIIFF